MCSEACLDAFVDAGFALPPRRAAEAPLDGYFAIPLPYLDPVAAEA